MVNSPLIRPYFLGGWHCGGYLRFPWCFLTSDTSAFMFPEIWLFDFSTLKCCRWGTRRPCTHAHRPVGQSKANQSDHPSSESPAMSGISHFYIDSKRCFHKKSEHHLVRGGVQSSCSKTNFEPILKRCAKVPHIYIYMYVYSNSNWKCSKHAIKRREEGKKNDMQKHINSFAKSHLKPLDTEW